MARKKATQAAKLALQTGRLRLDLPNFVPYRITSLAALLRRAFADIYRDDPGLSEPEWKVMTTLAHYGPLSSGDVGYYVTLDRVAVSRALSRLLKLGLASRTENTADQRMFTVDLTRRATKVYDRMATEALSLEEYILTRLDQQEVRELLRLLDKIESCFHGPADLRRMALMRAAQEIGIRATSSRPHKRHAKASINATT